VTAIQLVTAYSAVANGGVRFAPRLVHDLFLGQVHDPLPPVPGHRVISARTASLVKQILAAVVERGTGQAAQLVGYSSAGKTGTAQKIDPSGAYSKSHYVASFVGFAPVGKPAVTILVALESPVGAIYGAEVAAPVFRTIAEQTLRYMNIPHDTPSRWPQFASSKLAETPGQKLGDFAGPLPKGSEHLQAAASPVQPASFSRIEQTGITSDREPEAPTVVMDNGPRVTIPDFSGLAARSIAQQCQKLGLELSLVGSGLAVEQNLPAHAQAPLGTRLVVRLSR
jgi:membrane peptidoglycan carboxypeptidase